MAMRVGAWLDGSRPWGWSPQTREDSIHGSAILTPRPRSIVRREKTDFISDPFIH